MIEGDILGCRNEGPSILLLVLLVIDSLPPGAMQDKKRMKMSAVPKTPEWQKLSTLVGNWEGFMEEGGKQTPATVEVRRPATARPSCVMGRGTPQMVTMFRRTEAAGHALLRRAQPAAWRSYPRRRRTRWRRLVDRTNIALAKCT
jgi:hypothetical protein